MTATADQFIKALQSSGVLKPEQISQCLTQLPKGEAAADAAALAAQFVARGALTDFQSQKILEGRGAALVFGDYVVTDLIGAGGMGQVFKARRRRMNRPVAIKLLPRSALQRPDAVKRFQREVEAAARLLHPNIVAAFDAGETRGQHYLVMEYVDGKDLAAVVKQRGRLPIELAINYIGQAARGLGFAHAKGIVHRDVKPANLLVDAAGVVKILDMGLAQFEDPALADQGLTQAGQLMGTIDYMAPEQAANTHLADARADIYALGCTLYFLLNAKRVYDGSSMLEKLRAHKELPIPTLAAARPNVPAALDAVFQKMIAKRPEDRFQSMAEVIGSLEAIQRGAPASAGAENALARFAGAGETALGPSLAAGAATTIALNSTANQSAATRSGLARVVTSEHSKHWLGKILGGVLATVVAPIVVTYLIKFLDKPASPPGAPSAAASGDPVRPRTDQSSAAASASSAAAAGPKSAPHLESPAGGPGVVPVAQRTPPPEPPPRAIDDKPLKAARPVDAPFTAEVARSAQTVWARRLKITPEETNSIDMKLELIPPGAFTMGSSREVVERVGKIYQGHGVKPGAPLMANLDGEAHPHRVTLSKPFLLGATEVTVAQFRRFVEAKKPHYRTDAERSGAAENWHKPPYKISDDQPATCVSWQDAVEFCNWLSEHEKLPAAYVGRHGSFTPSEEVGGYRLPTEAEWEFACRAGTTTLYYFGDDPGELRAWAWFGEARGAAKPVRQFPANPFGLYDMHGGAFEWCQDWYDATSYVTGPTLDPVGPPSGDRRVRRGGGFSSHDVTVRSGTRLAQAPDVAEHYAGFRVARTLFVPPVENHKPRKNAEKPAEKKRGA